MELLSDACDVSFVGPNPALGITRVTNAQLMRYIEVMARRGYTKDCSISVDAVARSGPRQFHIIAISNPARTRAPTIAP